MNLQTQMEHLDFFGANSRQSSAENLTYTMWKFVSAKRALFPTVLIHSLGKGHEHLPKFFCWDLEVPRYHC